MDNPSKSRKNLFSYVGVLAIILLAGFLIWTKNNQNNASTNQFLPDPSISPLGNPPTQGNTLKIEDCNIKQENNPLVQGVRTVGNTVVGTLYGNIQELNSQTGQSGTIKMISPKADQIYNLTFPDGRNLFYDGIEQKDIKFSDLQKGQTIVATFNCYPQKGNLFKIIQVTVVGK